MSEPLDDDAAPSADVANDREHGPKQLTEAGRERKQALMDAAAELFSKRGYAETRVLDICTAAGVAKGLFYWYFDTKEALFIELVESMRLRLRKFQAAQTDPTADPLTRLRQGAEASVRFMAEHAPYFSLMEVEPRDEQLAELMRRNSKVHTGDSATIIAEGIELGQIVNDDPTILALGIVGAVSHYSHFHRAGRVKMSIDELAIFTGDWVVRALARPTS
jgi:AcrR family transcriptional regulator